MVFLVRQKRVVAAIAHVLLFQCEMRRDLREDLAECVDDLGKGGSFAHPAVEVVDQFDQVAVFGVDGRHADAEFVFPFDQAHLKWNPPVSALNVIVR